MNRAAICSNANARRRVLPSVSGLGNPARVGESFSGFMVADLKAHINGRFDYGTENHY